MLFAPNFVTVLIGVYVAVALLVLLLAMWNSLDGDARREEPWWVIVLAAVGWPLVVLGLVLLLVVALVMVVFALVGSLKTRARSTRETR